jgi:hypothetical protein
LYTFNEPVEQAVFGAGSGNNANFFHLVKIKYSNSIPLQFPLL